MALSELGVDFARLSPRPAQMLSGPPPPPSPLSQDKEASTETFLILSSIKAMFSWRPDSVPPDSVVL